MGLTNCYQTRRVDKSQIFLEFIEFRSRGTGYCFSFKDNLLIDFNKEYKVNLSMRTLYRMLNKLVASEDIIKERSGNRTIYWTKASYENKTIMEELCPPKWIGTKKMAIFFNQKKQQIIEPKNIQKVHMQMTPVWQSNDTCLAVDSLEHKGMNLSNLENKEVVYSKASQTTYNFGSKKPPFFHNNFEQDIKKETMSDEERSRLIEIYGKQEVEKRERNALAFMKKLAAQKRGNLYNIGLFEYTRRYCEENQKAKANRIEKAKKITKESIPMRLDDLIQERKKKVEEHPLSSKYLLRNLSGFGSYKVNQSLVSKYEYEKLEHSGFSLYSDMDPDGFDARFSRVIEDLKRIENARNCGI